MNYGIGFLFFLLPMYISDSLSAYIVYLLAGRRMPYRKVFALQIPAAFIQTVAFFPLVFVDDSSNIPLINYLLRAFYSVSETVIRASWVCFLFRDTNKKKRFFYVSAVFPFGMLAAFGTNALIIVIPAEFVGGSFSDMIWNAKMVFQYSAPSLLVHGVVAVIVRLLSKTNFWNKLQAFGNYPKLYMPMGMIYFLVYIAFFTFSAHFMSIAQYLVGINLSYLALLGLVVLLVSDLKRTENLNAVRALLLQQQNYINKLESAQKEIRSIQHDYKNMLAGLYAQASEGNAEAVKEYIDAKLLKIDETVREDLRQMNQLTRIEIPELKGLILTKMLEAERDKVPFRLEVMLPVSRKFIEVEDLLRCVGILLDNAIEAARTQEDAVVTLLLLQEAATLTIVVKNPARVKPDLFQIGNKGYSTKGPCRGVGLSNYQNIIRKYPNATQETKIEGEHFVQILVLAGNQ